MGHSFIVFAAAWTFLLWGDLLSGKAAAGICLIVLCGAVVALADVSAAAVAGFCMSTAPYGSPDMSQKILQLIASCETLAADFHQYRNALLPVTLSAEGSSGVVTPIHSVRMSHIQSWEREGSRNAAVSDFKVFSVNCVRKILGKKGFPEGINAFSDDDRAALERTANVWLRSVGTTDNSPRRVSL